VEKRAVTEDAATRASGLTPDRFFRRWQVLTLLSLMGGALLLLVGLAIFYVPPAAGDAGTLTWRGDDLAASVRPGVTVAGGIKLTLDANGLAAVILPLPAGGFSFQNHPFVSLGTGDLPQGLSISLLWQREEAPNRLIRYPVPPRPESGRWISMLHVPGWSGTMKRLGIGFRGKAGQAVVLQRVTLAPPSLWRFLGAVYAEWAAPEPWQQTSINVYRGVGSRAPLLYPVPTLASLLGLSLLVYASLWVARRRSLRFDWRVPSALAVACWLALDLPWQAQLWTRLVTAHDRFAGLTMDQRHLAAADRSLFAFAERVGLAISERDPRLFLATGSDYAAVRIGYYLFPSNVFWRRGGPELPGSKYLRRGDYIVLFLPKEVRYDAGTQRLLWPGKQALKVQSVLLERTGGLFRVL
jgi:hypothetical protein